MIPFIAGALAGVAAVIAVQKRKEIKHSVIEGADKVQEVAKSVAKKVIKKVDDLKSKEKDVTEEVKEEAKEEAKKPTTRAKK